MTDYFDNAIGSGSKKETHIWSNIEAGMLHRAFSVFLFTPEGKLILQQRSGAKITFPYIWANTCCSHPLSVPSEMETADAMGVKNAARRKLEHELGIPPEDVPLECFTFITRVHYVGASEPKDGSAPVWGEHEIDWILMCTPPRMPRMALNMNEVEGVRAFSQAELKEWMATRATRGDEVSPWFGVMEKSLLYKWWDAVLTKRLDTVLERDVIHRQHDLEARVAGVPSYPMPAAFAATLAATTVTASAAPHDTTPAHAGPKVSSVGAAVIPGATASTPKQGAYGKVKIHSESTLSQLSHLDEVWAALCFKSGWTSATKVKQLAADASPAQEFCERMLVKVSRSFAMVIQQLPDHLRLSVCIFYLVLRGLDTVEDDMVAFAGRQEEKLGHLRNFYKYLKDTKWTMSGVGEGDEAILLQNFAHVNVVFGTLPPVEQEVIADICKRMGEGMASFAGRDLREGTIDIADYNLYCHYVAGLVGEGLSRLFVARGDEAPAVAANLKLADDMGLFLQKTNIIRDYLEDLVEGRAFWPREVWSQYAPGLANLRYKVDALLGCSEASEDARAQEDQSRACLNHLIADALSLAPSCLRYMESLRHPEIFRFCAIPQVMAIATLDKLTNNADVFTGVVKIRKGQALLLMNQATSMQNLYGVFLKHTRSIAAAIPRHHKAAYAIASKAAAEVEAICLSKMDPAGSGWASTLFSPAAVVFVLAAFFFLLRNLYLRSKSGAWGTNTLPRITDSADVAVLTGVVACVMYLFACAGVPLVLRMGPAPSSPSHKGMVPKTLDDESEATLAGAAGVSAAAASADAGARRRSARHRE